MFSVQNTKKNISIVYVMQGYRFGVKIGSSALGLDSRCGEVGSFLNEAGSVESDGVVSFLKYEHTDYLRLSTHFSSLKSGMP